MDSNRIHPPLSAEEESRQAEIAKWNTRLIDLEKEKKRISKEFRAVCVDVEACKETIRLLKQVGLPFD